MDVDEEGEEDDDEGKVPSTIGKADIARVKTEGKWTSTKEVFLKIDYTDTDTKVWPRLTTTLEKCMYPCLLNFGDCFDSRTIRECVSKEFKRFLGCAVTPLCTGITFLGMSVFTLHPPTRSCRG